jgi:hypothetical protein
MLLLFDGLLPTSQPAAAVAATPCCSSYCCSWMYHNTLHDSWTLPLQNCCCCNAAMLEA